MTFFPTETTRLQKLLLSTSVLASLLMLAFFMQQYGIDLLMGDRIDTWNPLFNNANLWEGFVAQHGPHRMGMLFIFSKIGYLLGHTFNTRYDLYVNALIIWSTVPVGLWIKYRITNTFNWSDVLIPFIIVAPWQWATLIINPHIHVMLPLFTLWFAVLLISKYRDNIGLNMALVFLALFSVYALFATGLFVGLQLLRWLKEKNYKNSVILLLFALVLLLYYFTNFRWNTLVSTGAIQILPALKAPFLLLANFFYLPNWMGVLIVTALAILTFKYFTSQNYFKPKNLALLMLIGALGLFVFLQALGRSGDDPTVFSATRYYTEIVLVIWVFAILIAKYQKHKLVSVFVPLAFTWVLVQPNNPKRKDWKEFTAKAGILKQCVLTTKDYNTCNKDSKLLLHHNPEKAKMVEKWILLEERKEAYLEK